MKKHYYFFLFLFLSIVGCESIDMNELPVTLETEFQYDSYLERGFSFNVNPRAATYIAETHYPGKKIKSLDPISI